jgi:hypothetical protein
MHVLDCKELIWKCLLFQSLEAFRAIGVYGHSLLYLQGSLYSFGGCDANQHFCKAVLKFDIQACEWLQLKTKGTPPTCRNRHGAFIHFDANEEHSMYIIGVKTIVPKNKQSS